jgi:hypothetical protein
MYGKRYRAWLAGWIGVYALLLFGSSELLDGRIVTWQPMRVLVALIPMIPACGVLALVMRTYRSIDELERKIIADGIIFGFGITAIVTFSYGFLQRFAGAPDLSYFFVWAIMGAAWFVGSQIARFRYR